MIKTLTNGPASEQLPQPHLPGKIQPSAAQSDAAIPASNAGRISSTGYLGPATVIERNEREQLVLVQWQKGGQSCLSWARPALVTSAQFHRGDTALVLSQNLEDFYLIGILAERMPALPAASAPLRTPSGASVALSKTKGEESIQVRSKQGGLVLEYRPESGKTVVNVAKGDLEFVTQAGSIAFHSAKKISFVAHRLETIATTVVSKAKNVYRTVEELTQLQTGRLRTLVKGSYHLKARDTFLKAEKDFKVDGDQIHLG